MKQASAIISHIRNLPEFKLLKKHYCYQKFISLLSPRFQKAIAFVYIKNETLFVALSHPGFKMELNYNKNSLKEVLSMLANMDEKCKNMRASKVILFNSKHISIIKEKKIVSTVPYYQEMAWGEFNIESEDEELIEAFNKIKISIDKNI
ncbi:MAG: hypothetical protein KAG56_00500 [Sulfurovaceae bacterium]|nr:hypothetical protein [Sulfurovaceae bacterium]